MLSLVMTRARKCDFSTDKKGRIVCNLQLNIIITVDLMHASATRPSCVCCCTGRLEISASGEERLAWL